MTTQGHEGSRIEVRGLTKHFGKVAAVQDLSFSVEPGRITGFLGPNGAGKTTTLRMLLSLVTPTSGTATIGGTRYADLAQPQRVVGAALEASSFHPGRNARNHLRVLGQTCGMGADRADQLLELVGLTAAAKRRVGGFSMGMRQRLGLAGALVGDPSVLILDEPANGLDPEGIRWLRGFLRALAAEGRTILVSSHMLSEVQQTVDDVVIISQGRAVKQSTLAELEAEARSGVLVRAADPAALASLVQRSQLGRRPAPRRRDPGPRRPGPRDRPPRLRRRHRAARAAVDRLGPGVDVLPAGLARVRRPHPRRRGARPATTGHEQGGRTMSAVSAELLKVRTTKVWWGILIGAIVWVGGLSALAAAFTGRSIRPEHPDARPDDPDVARGVLHRRSHHFGYVFTMVLGVLVIGTEYRHQTITPTLLGTPRRLEARGGQVGLGGAVRRALRRGVPRR